jgi:hypothetical protein
LDLHRTLRSSGCKATILVLTEETIAANFSRACGVNVISLGTIQESDMERISMVRHWLFSKFLWLYRLDFDRVIICDPERSLAQGDPFTFHFTSLAFGLPYGGVDIMNSPVLDELETVDHFYDKGVYADLRALSAGLMYGSMDAMLRMYEIVMKHDRLESGKAKESFDSYLNYCYANRLFERHQFHIVLRDLGDDFTHVSDESLLVSIWDSNEWASPKSLLVRPFERPPLLISLGTTGGILFNSVCVLRPSSWAGRRPEYFSHGKTNFTRYRPAPPRKRWRRHRVMRHCHPIVNSSLSVDHRE